MDKVTIRALVLAAVLGLLALPLGPVCAQAPLEPTQIVIGAPAQSNPAEPLTVQAVLADSQGHPISKARIYFTTQGEFLGDKGDVVLAEAVTNGNGQAVARVANDFSGSIALSAEFRGDAQYAPSNATVQLVAPDEVQLYAEHVGVDLPGFNVPPLGASKASLQSPQQGIDRFLQSLWPAMNGWPLAAVLLIVWSTYLLALTFVFRVASSGGEPEDSASADPRRLL
jgi:hypothetical protein